MFITRTKEKSGLESTERGNLSGLGKEHMRGFCWADGVLLREGFLMGKPQKPPREQFPMQSDAFDFY